MSSTNKLAGLAVGDRVRVSLEAEIVDLCATVFNVCVPGGTRIGFDGIDIADPSFRVEKVKQLPPVGATVIWGVNVIPWRCLAREDNRAVLRRLGFPLQSENIIFWAPNNMPDWRLVEDDE